MAQETELEALLRRSLEEPELLLVFYAQLLEAEVLVPVQVPIGKGANSAIPAGSDIDVITLVMASGEEIVPFYTSASKVYEASPNGERCVLMRTRELFEAFRRRPDMHFYLNPSSEYGRSFSPAEAAGLIGRRLEATVSEVQLEALMRRAVADSQGERDFLLALPNANLYTLAPLSDDHPRLRLWMFQRPDGVNFIPYFTNEVQAREAAANSLRIVSMLGRELLEISRGAMVVVNPNHEACTVYPEEIEALLEGFVAVIHSEQLTADREILASRPRNPPAWLTRTLRELYATLPFVTRAWLVETRQPVTPDESVMLVCIEAESQHCQRASHATITALQQKCVEEKFPLDVIASDPQRLLSVTNAGLLIYTKAPPRALPQQ